MSTNTENITRALGFLQEIIIQRLDDFFKKENAQPFNLPGYRIVNDQAPVNHFLVEHNLSIEECTILLLALVPHIQPNFIDSIVLKYLPRGGEFPEIGGSKGNNQRCMLPTGETALFILAGLDINERIEIQQFFSKEHYFYKKGILRLETPHEGEPAMSGRIILGAEWIEYLLTGTMPTPEFSPDFPAKLLKTKMVWSDLVLHTYTLDLLSDIRHWIDHHPKLYCDKNLSPKIKLGYKALFYGPPGTGKTLTASLLGKEFDKEVFRVDLSMVVSKYIGETEKNLGKIFEKAMNKEWILFFDEADALFSKRTAVQSAHDKYANQEASYLLQQVEDFQGLLILASNFKSNIDEAFLRRFNNIIHFPKPDVNERLKLWQNCIPGSLTLDKNIQLKQLAAKYELTGAMIINIMQYATIRTFASGNETILNEIIADGIRKEFNKDEKSAL